MFIVQEWRCRLGLIIFETNVFGFLLYSKIYIFVRRQENVEVNVILKFNNCADVFHEYKKLLLLIPFFIRVIKF